MSFIGSCGTADLIAPSDLIIDYTVGDESQTRELPRFTSSVPTCESHFIHSHSDIHSNLNGIVTVSDPTSTANGAMVIGKTEDNSKVGSYQIVVTVSMPIG